MAFDYRVKARTDGDKVVVEVGLPPLLPLTYADRWSTQTVRTAPKGCWMAKKRSPRI